MCHMYSIFLLNYEYKQYNSKIYLLKIIFFKFILTSNSKRGNILVLFHCLLLHSTC